MDRFVSHHVLRLDAKGRVSVPASFRAVLARDGFDGLYCHPALDRPALDAGGNALLAEIEALIAGFPPYSEEREQFSLALYGTSETLKIDGEGRVVLTDAHKAHAGITDAVIFVGLGHKFRIWEPGRFRAELAEATEKVRAFKAELGARTRGGKTARSTGMMTGGDSQLSLADWPVIFPCSSAAPSNGSPCATAASMSTPRSAPAAIRRAILRTPGARVIGIDRDQSAIARGADLVEQAQGRLELVEDRFSNLQSIAGTAAVDGVVFDLGVSSMQLDEAERGFSFRLDGPLDMRMGRDGPSAADVVAHAGERDLAAIIATLGEERHARAVARAIVKARRERAIDTTRALADIVARVVHARDGAIHPATRTFQALRIFVNDELVELARGLAAAERVLKPCGAPGRRRLPFARRPDRQEFPRRAQPRAGLFAASAGNGGGRRRPSAR